jgi:polysaccharide deacetylase 2 family uncharacterized protein YibQ
VVLGVLLCVLLVTVITFSVLLRSGNSSSTAGKPLPGKAHEGGSDTRSADVGARTSAPAGADKKSSGYLWVSLKAGYPKAAEKRSVSRPPAVAIVIDDVGNTADPLPLWMAIDAPLSFSVMPYPPLSRDLSLRIRQGGYKVMMHIPTQNAPPNSFSGMGQLAVGMSRETVFSELEKDLAAVPLASGINNHQGGLGCDDPSLMSYEVEWARQRGLYVVDSESSNNSQVSPACLAQGLPQRRNEVFIDHQNEPDYIRAAMRRLADIARQNGTAIGICHWHRPNTAAVVGEMVRQLKNEGINFSYAGDVSN